MLAFVNISSFDGREDGSKIATRTVGTPVAAIASKKVSYMTHPKWAPKSLMMGRNTAARLEN